LFACPQLCQKNIFKLEYAVIKKPNKNNRNSKAQESTITKYVLDCSVQARFGKFNIFPCDEVTRLDEKQQACAQYPGQAHTCKSGTKPESFDQPA